MGMILFGGQRAIHDLFLENTRKDNFYEWLEKDESLYGKVSEVMAFNVGGNRTVLEIRCKPRDDAVQLFLGRVHERWPETKAHILKFLSETPPKPTA